jgi:tetratricopeptide (TPR) repeat protein
MALRPKSKKRLFIVAGLGVAVVAAGGSAYGIRKHQMWKEIQALKPRGLAAYKAGETVDALNFLGPYLLRVSDDAEVLEAYADVRAKVAEPKQRHMYEAMGMYRRLVGLRPTDLPAKMSLLTIYGKTGMNTEAVQLADELLRKDPANLDVKQKKAAALIGLRKFDDAKALVDDVLAADPMALPAGEYALSLMANNGETGAPLVRRVQVLTKGHEAEPQARYLMAIAQALSKDVPAAQEAARGAAAAEPPTADFARKLVSVLEQLQQFPQAADLLRRSAAKFKGEEFLDEYYERLVYQGQYAKVAQDLADPAAEADKRTALTAMRVIALCELGKTAEAKPLLEVLGTRGARWDTLAGDWRDVLTQVYFAPEARERQKIDAYLAAADRDPANPFYQEYLGDAYTASGDSNEAMARWQGAAQRAPAWAMPFARLAKYYLATNRPAQALALAMAAEARLPNQRETLVIKAQAWSATVDIGDARQAERLLEEIKRIEAAFPQEETAKLLHIAVLARTNERPEAARARIRQLLEATPAPAESTLLELCKLSNYLKLGAEEECLQASERAHGMTPNLALLRVALLVRAGKTDDAKAYMEKARAGGAADPEAWAIAWCQTLEAVRDERAAAEWKTLSATREGSAKAQWAALAASSVRRDRAMTGEVLDRLAKVVGEDGLTWRLEKGRWLLEDTKSRQSQDAAAKLLLETVNRSPQSGQARELLAASYESTGNIPSAVQQLTVSADLQPQEPRVRLSLGRLLIRQKDLIRAAQVLRQVLSLPATDPQKREAGMLLAQAGDFDTSTRALEALAAGDDTGQAEPLLAALYWRRGEIGKASALFERLLAKPTLAVVGQATSFYTSCGRLDDAERTIGLLGNLSPKPGEREWIEGNYRAQRGQYDQAVKLLAVAADVMKDNPEAWRRLLATSLAAAKVDDALARVATARKLLPDDKTCEALAYAGAGLKSLLSTDPDVRAYFVTCLMEAGGNDGVVAAAKALAGAKSPSPADLVAALQPVLSANQRATPLQVLAIRKGVQSGQFQEALRLAKQAMLSDPNSPLPVLFASMCHAQLGQWSEALAAAQRWRAIVPGNTASPDVFIAQSFLQMDRADDAIKLLEQNFKTAAPENPAYRDMLTLLAGIKLQRGAADEAAALLWPWAEKDATWRPVWLRLASEQAPAAAVGTAWLDRLAAITPTDDMNGQANLAMARHTLGKRFKDDAMVRRAVADMRALAEAADKPVVAAQLWLAAGSLYDSDGDAAGAEACYRQALAKDDTLRVSSPAANNLAMVLGNKGEKLDEAVAWAKKAVAAASVAPYYDTLAFVLNKNRQTDEAQQAIGRAIELDPANPEWKINAAEMLLAAGKRSQAQEMFGRVDLLQPDASDLTPGLRERYVKLKNTFRPPAETGDLGAGVLTPQR